MRVVVPATHQLAAEDPCTACKDFQSSIPLNTVLFFIVGNMCRRSHGMALLKSVFQPYRLGGRLARRHTLSSDRYPKMNGSTYKMDVCETGIKRGQTDGACITSRSRNFLIQKSNHYPTYLSNALPLWSQCGVDNGMA
jgi:hypothetical protein